MIRIEQSTPATVASGDSRYQGMQSRHASIATWAVRIALAVALLSMLAFLLYFDRARFDSDNAAASMLAEAMRLRGSLLPSGWTYNNGDLMMPSGALLIAVLISVLPNGFLAHAIFSVCALLMMLGAVWSLVRQLSWPRIVVACVCTVFVAGISGLFTEMVYAQSTYVWWPAGFLGGAAIILGYRRQTSIRYGWLRVLALFAIVATISFANPGRVALMMVAPLYAFDLCLRSSGADATSANAQPARSLPMRLGLFDSLTLFGIGAAFVVAAAAYAYLQVTGRIPSAYGAARLHWGGWTSVPRHIAVFVEGWPAYLGAMAPSATRPWSLGWFIATVTWLFSLALIAVAFDALRRLRHSVQPVRRALSWAFVVSFAPIFLMYIALDPLAIDSTTMRYFTVAICILIVLAGFILSDVCGAGPRAAALGIAVITITFVAAGLLRVGPFLARDEGQLVVVGKSPNTRLGDLLQRENLHWGYATWWNAGATTVLSDSRVRVSPVEIRPSGISPFSTMTLRDWYSPEAWHGPTFLVLARKELTPDISRPIAGALGKPARVLESNDYRVIVYDHNIAGSFGCVSDDRLDARLSRDDHPVAITAVEWNRVDADVRALSVRVRNTGTRAVTSIGRYPLSIGVQLLDAAGSVVAPDFVHAALSCAIAPGQESIVNVWLPDATQQATTVRVDLVQEGVAWFQAWGEKTWDLPLAAVGGQASETNQ